MIIPLVLALVCFCAGVVRGSQNSTKTTVGRDIENWIPPEYLLKNYPYYYSGFDDDNRPIWICEFGKWDLRKYFDEGRDIKVLEEYMDQAVYRFQHGLPRDKYPPGDIPDDNVVIADMDGFTVRQVSSVPTLTFILSLASRFGKLEKHVAYGYFVNLNYVAERVYSIARPLIGSVLERIEVYGTNSAKWIPKLHRVIPREQLPPWYGGNKEFVPVGVYG